MSVHITDDCINCSACETECPVHAIMPKLNVQNILNGKRPKYLNNLFMAKYYQSFDHYYIIPSKCNECQNVYATPRCNAVCPVSSCIADEEVDAKDNTRVRIKISPVSLTKISLN